MKKETKIFNLIKKLESNIFSIEKKEKSDKKMSQINFQLKKKKRNLIKKFVKINFQLKKGKKMCRF